MSRSILLVTLLLAGSAAIADELPSADREQLQLGLGHIYVVRTSGETMTGGALQVHLSWMALADAAEHMRYFSMLPFGVDNNLSFTWKDIFHIPLGILEMIYETLIGCPLDGRCTS